MKDTGATREQRRHAQVAVQARRHRPVVHDRDPAAGAHQLEQCLAGGDLADGRPGRGVLAIRARRSCDRLCQARDVVVGDVLHEDLAVRKIAPAQPTRAGPRGDGVASAVNGDGVAGGDLDALPGPVARGLGHDGQVDLVGQQRRQRAPGRLDHDIEIEARMAGLEMGERRGQPVVRDVTAGRDPQGGSRLGLGRERLLQRRQLLQQRPGGADEARASGGGDHTLADPVEQPRAQVALQIDELVAHGRLREVQAVGGAGDAGLGGDGAHEPQVPDLEEAGRGQGPIMRIVHGCQ